MSRHCRTLQKTRAIAAIPKNTTINPMYSGGPEKRRNMWHIVAVFAPVAKNLPQ